MKPTQSILRSIVARKIFVLLAFCALLPVGGLVYFSLRQVYGNLEEQAHQRLRHASKNVGMSIYNGFFSLWEDMEILLASLRGGSPPGSFHGDAELPATRPLKRALLAATLFREGGGHRILFGSKCPLPPATDPVRLHLASGKPVVFSQARAGRPDRIFLAFSARDERGRHALMVGEINEEYLWSLARIATPGNMDIDILGRGGIPLFSSRPVPEPLSGLVENAMKRSSSGPVTWNVGGRTFLGEYWLVFLKGGFQSENWTVVASLPSEEVFAPVREFTRVFLLLLLLTGTIVLLLATVLVRRNLAPLARLIEGTGRIRQGEFASRVDIRSGDEFEDLARSFNAMSERLEFQFRAMKEANLRMEREIAVRKQAEEEKALLGMAVEQVAESILITDPRGTVLYANPAFERTSGFRRKEVVGEEIRTLVSPDLNKDRLREIRHAWLRGEVWTGKIAGRRKDGSRLEEELILSPVRNDDGRIIHYVVSKRDVTAEVQLEERLRHSEKMEAVGKLAGGISHDFNNLLTAVIGYSEILLMKLDGNDPIRKEVAGIHYAGERASHLVRQLLTFSRKQVNEPKVIDLNEVLSGIDMMLQRLIRENIRVRTIPGEGPWSIRADPSQVELAIVNLAVNARDAMPDGGTLTIETANRVAGGASDRPHPVGRPGKYVALKVTDTGCGMDESTRSRIFEPFFTTKEPGKGTGLGLSAVYGIVNQSGGSICVESEPGKGTAFTIYFPALEVLPEPREEETGSRAGKHGGTETILLAEDEGLVRDLARSILAARGYNVLEARDGRESVEIGRSHEGPIQLLVTDMVMPHMGGREAAARLQEIRPGIRILYMSGYLEDATFSPGDVGSEVSFLQKPFHPDALARKVRELLDGSGRKV